MGVFEKNTATVDNDAITLMEAANEVAGGHRALLP